MKILALNYRDRMHPAAGGAERHLHQIFSRLVERGHQVVLLTTSFPGASEREIVDGILVVRHGGDLTFQFTVAKYLKKLDKEFDFDVVYEDLNKLPLFTPQLTKKPHLVQIHHLWRSSIFAETNFVVAFGVWLFETLIPRIYQKSRFVAVSPSTIAELEKLGVGHNRIALVYNGTNGAPAGFEKTEKSVPQESSIAGNVNAPYFLWLSRVHKYKGILTALEAFKIFAKSHKNVRLKIAGDGPMLKDLPKILDRLDPNGNLDLARRIDLLGFVSKERKTELMAGALALLQTSYKEGWGLTVIEAAELGTTTIASKVPGLVDSVRDGETGLLFKKKSAKDCANCMSRIAEIPELRRTLETGAETFAATFSWDRAANETEKLLLNIINAHSPHGENACKNQENCK